ncbi:toll/interleukin-1 receptor domain-containing protein [Sinorhizobium sp. NFACC03]|uniref:toll/interleukin-1 receptor domain-containing protein n=1 Tax=Sinorhizobium sp. NFACC03 TaxID=1566295 RepID=UPI0008919FBA|nr:toll/interleukin-1 receptor domain-containing protein [Sinorhizobium sp. NFACC03]SDA39673.1 TIR domain-containing protein [Sinorhizobium sp. NFACC03]
MAKVFISHQHADSSLAKQIADRLRSYHSIDSYLDVIDPNLTRGEDLARHIQQEMGKCNQLLAVISEKTRESWWVPWEIGVATEKDFPLATYAGGSTMPPEFLRKWPYLRSEYDLDLYARASKAAETSYNYKRGFGHQDARPSSTREFYDTLRKSLGQ